MSESGVSIGIKKSDMRKEGSETIKRKMRKRTRRRRMERRKRRKQRKKGRIKR